MTALAIAGDLTFNPMKDELVGSDGKRFKLESPTGKELPPSGFDPGENTYQSPSADGSKVSFHHAQIFIYIIFLCSCLLLTFYVLGVREDST